MSRLIGLWKARLCQEFEQSIAAALAYLDDAVLLVLELLQVRLRRLLDEHVLSLGAFILSLAF